MNSWLRCTSINKNKLGGIYCIKNIKTHKVYIGSTSNFHKRFKDHLCALRNNRHHCKHLQREYNKYGEKYFLFTIVKYVTTNQHLFIEENRWFKYYSVGNHAKCFNSAIVASCSGAINVLHDTVFKKRVSDRFKGIPKTDIHKQRIREAKLGVPRTLETKQKIKNNWWKVGMSPKRIRHLNHLNAIQKGQNNPNAKGIVCLETQEHFSYMDAIKTFIGKFDRSNLWFACKNGTSFFGLHWMYEADYKNTTQEDIQERLNKSQKLAVYCKDSNLFYVNCGEAAKELGLSRVGLLAHCKNGFGQYKNYEIGYLKDLYGVMKIHPIYYKRK